MLVATHAKVLVTKHVKTHVLVHVQADAKKPAQTHVLVDVAMHAKIIVSINQKQNSL